MSKQLYEAAKAFDKETGGLWCVAQLDGNGNRIWKFSSGQGRPGEGPQTTSGNNLDAEERLVSHFPQMIAEHGQEPRSLQMITARTPCWEKCANKLRGLAATHNSLASILVASWRPFKKQSQQAELNSYNALNETVVAENYDVKLIFCHAKEISYAMLQAAGD
jgi:hypothetical protein